MQQDKIAILGAGSWGSALAFLLSGKGFPVTLWDRDATLTGQIEQTKINPKYLPEIALGETVSATSDMESALCGAAWVIVAVASDGIRHVMTEAADYLESYASLISACKGLEAETGQSASEVIAASLLDADYAGIAVLSGPNLARELTRGVPTASVIASLDPQIARAAQTLLMTETTFRVYTHSDVKGVELGGALKNVLAIGAGISDGLGFGDNTKAALMTRGLTEMMQLGVATGGKAITFLGLSGVGDLIATAASRLSRNYRVGLGLAEGKSIREILGELHQAAEGIGTASAAQLLSKQYGIETPVFETINNVLHFGKSPQSAVEELMTRAARDEFSV